MHDAPITADGNWAAFVLHAPRLRLALLSPDDAQRMLDYCVRNHAHLAPWEPRRAAAYYTLAYWSERIPALLDEARCGAAIRWVLTNREQANGPIIGTCSLTQIARGVSQSGILGYGLDHEQEGQGLMTEALRAVVGYAFGRLGLKRVMANYIPSNERSALLLKRLGFVVEGYGRELVFINGAWRDHIMTALLNPDPNAVASP
jgi:[ribosomal protein S5]-alanine N-acetyltransferase